MVWRDSVGVEGSRSGLKSECADIFHQSFPWLLHHTDEPQRAKQLSMATTPLCVEFFRCRVDVLQSSFSRSTISIAVFCLQNLICLLVIFADQVFIDPTFLGIFLCGPLQSFVVNVCKSVKPCSQFYFLFSKSLK